MLKHVITSMITAGLVLAPMVEAVAAKKDKKVLIKKNKKHKKISSKKAG